MSHKRGLAWVPQWGLPVVCTSSRIAPRDDSTSDDYGLRWIGYALSTNGSTRKSSSQNSVRSVNKEFNVNEIRLEPRCRPGILTIEYNRQV